MSTSVQLLIVSPDSAVRHVAHSCLLDLGHGPLLASDLRQARRIWTRVQIDLICLDSVLPATELERFWRWLSIDPERPAPTVLLMAPRSAKLAPASLPAFFQPQRDGLVTKPLQGGELAREVARLLAARPSRSREAELLRVNGLTLDGEARQLLFAEGGALPLTPTELRLVRYLMARPGEFVSLDELLEQVWGYPADTGSPEVVRSHVSNLRRKLRAMGEDPQLLRSIPYRGYGLVIERAVASSR